MCIRDSNCLNTNIYSYLETSGGQSSNPYSNAVHFFSTPVVIRHLWQLKTLIFLHWCLRHVVLLRSCQDRLNNPKQMWIFDLFSVLSYRDDAFCIKVLLTLILYEVCPPPLPLFTLSLWNKSKLGFLSFSLSRCHWWESMTFSIMTLSIMTFSIMTLSIMTLSIMTLSIMTLSIKGSFVTLSLNDI